ncbi:30S ribosomal protein S16 [Candidatus Curtissbacteria bacterium RIFCSPLOWO2_01_FULL_39_62]|uniref:Small ribosomal subunit protein bS16 n=2 Tax=Candidatus Curtissiibacteriota TaxID=1752717 RepID=A0A1F5G6C1_9BACT|nr:MAG: 30S ribosomal protein S16 [Candidatus Curtissbacteria bacterium RIFCSPHIGHO2_02_FULL_40_16b]OGD90713.1 MAG: 30S ribosomal protein S16 [Candidatus Curtissbacteria bacterium RIFCSPHIGHO2_12_FULL_38_37]OGE00690.1 MAG: 30S ribosomal protein S16 [Candidatus Curtissbacteria bacterium RIFCSPLOWO2_02_FULL_40_11]OGE01010.1 MAG: 30S ribosomal protein S16 [Candidatus Curtissbacteria bacterium RIFCSPLOWO2_01_FULL_39_62]OGE12664.1 MAG: 30S ribosomal protein S16 [Candidatus Curtissbacteria bacterium 
MAVKLRLAKTGKKHRLSFRVVAQDTKSPRDSKFLEILGYYLPYETKSKNLTIKTDRIDYWVSKGAQPTKAVSQLLEKNKNARFDKKSS